MSVIEVSITTAPTIEVNVQGGFIIEVSVAQNVVETSVIQQTLVETSVTQGSVIELDVITGGVGRQGPPGPPGGQSTTMIAGETLSRGRGVKVGSDGKVYYYQPSEPGNIYGITVTSGTTGSEVNVQIVGEVTDGSFTFTPGDALWFVDDGEIVSSPPINLVARLQKAGVSLGANKIKIDFSSLIIL